MKSIKASSWVKRGMFRVLRSALSIDDPESWPGIWKGKFGSYEGFPWEQAGIKEPVFICEKCGSANHNIIPMNTEDHRDLMRMINDVYEGR